MICERKHLPEIPDADFKCPRCGAPCGDFHIEEGHLDNECEKLAASDYLMCDKCSHGETAGVFYRRWMKAKSMITCPHCKGKGVVQR